MLRSFRYLHALRAIFLTTAARIQYGARREIQFSIEIQSATLPIIRDIYIYRGASQQRSRSRDYGRDSGGRARAVSSRDNDHSKLRACEG